MKQFFQTEFGVFLRISDIKTIVITNLDCIRISIADAKKLASEGADYYIDILMNNNLEFKQIKHPALKINFLNMLEENS